MTSNTIYHMHHIVPKHMGGTDDPSNLIKLTVEEHAAAHLKLYEEHGKWEDKLAWKALSGQISMPEASREAWIKGCYKGGYAKKPNSVPAYNKVELYCIGCRRRDKPYNIMNKHIKCIQDFYGIQPNKNPSYFSSEFGKKKAAENNSNSTCPHCGKSGQYRAMKRWHFDKCKHLAHRSNLGDDTRRSPFDTAP